MNESLCIDIELKQMVRQLEIVNLILCDFSVLMWSYFSCGTILSGGLNINAEILEGEHFYVTVEKEEGRYFLNS